MVEAIAIDEISWWPGWIRVMEVPLYGVRELSGGGRYLGADHLAAREVTFKPHLLVAASCAVTDSEPGRGGEAREEVGGGEFDGGLVGPYVVELAGVGMNLGGDIVGVVSIFVETVRRWTPSHR